MAASSNFSSFLPPDDGKLVSFDLWQLFDKLFSAVAGFAPEDFRLVVGSTPLTTLSETTKMIMAYYVIIFGGQYLMKSQKALKLNTLFMSYNLCLTIISASLLALFLEDLVPKLWKNGVFHNICSSEGGWTNRLVVLYYINYLTKYLELSDTMFLVLRKKPLTFLHCYHHGATAFLCFTQLAGLTPVSWVPITLNLFVHVLMYWYYFQSARGIRVSWKEWITRLQIMQFVIDLGFVYFASYTLFVFTYFPWLPHRGTCDGKPFAAYAGIGILSSYLLLFISFYAATYKKKGPRKVE